jgi:hypothetical protein
MAITVFTCRNTQYAHPTTEAQMNTSLRKQRQVAGVKICLFVIYLTTLRIRQFMHRRMEINYNE